MGHWEFAGATEQSADWDGEYADSDAGAAEGQTGGGGRERAAVYVGEPTKPAATDPRCEGYGGGGDCAGTRGMDWSGMMAESVFVLTHADETGSTLTKASLEAVTAGKALAARLSA